VRLEEEVTMADEYNKLNIDPLPAEARQDGLLEQVSLTRGDILSDDTLHLTVESQQVTFPESEAVGPAAPVLQVEELLTSIDSHSSLAGGFLTFDSESNPGHTIVRVMLDDTGSQQAFEVGVFNGVDMDLNTLLGLISSSNGDPS
jgi:hypothetical protein